MKRSATILAGVLLGAALLAPAAFAGRGGGQGYGPGGCNGPQVGCRQQRRACWGGQQQCGNNAPCRNADTRCNTNCPGPQNCPAQDGQGGANQAQPGGDK